jgi:hypothetical protein
MLLIHRSAALSSDPLVEEAVKFEVVMNVKAAQALGLTIPASLRQEVERVELP